MELGGRCFCLRGSVEWEFGVEGGCEAGISWEREADDGIGAGLSLFGPVDQDVQAFRCVAGCGDLGGVVSGTGVFLHVLEGVFHEVDDQVASSPAVVGVFPMVGYSVCCLVEESVGI